MKPKLPRRPVPKPTRVHHTRRGELARNVKHKKPTANQED